MSSAIPKDETRIVDTDQLVQFLGSREKSESQWVVGTEHEKFGWHLSQGRPPAYDGPSGIQAVLSGFVDLGWEPIFEHGVLLALSRSNATITLEPGGQLELSGAPFRSLLSTEVELQQHLKELEIVSQPLDLQWSGLGFTPWGEPLDMPLMPKPRYGILQSHLETAGRLGLHMMRQTATVQANLDYASEEDAFRKFRAALWIQPVVTAIYANSPVVNGREVSSQSYRAAVWQDTAPARCRLPARMWSQGARYEDYMQWTLDVPMIFIHRDDRYVDVRGRTFREFIKEGALGHSATLGDYALHLSTLFPDVRMKTHLEVRAADMGSPEYVLALPAFHAGLLYDERALAAVLALFEQFDHTQWSDLVKAVPEQGFDARLGERSLAELADSLFELSWDGLARWEPDAQRLLTPLRKPIEQRRCPGDELRGLKGDVEAILKKSRLVAGA